jgi:hypothetical protein
VEDVFPKTAFEKPFFKKKLCRKLSKDLIFTNWRHHRSHHVNPG